MTSQLRDSGEPTGVNAAMQSAGDRVPSQDAAAEITDFADAPAEITEFAEQPVDISRFEPPEYTGNYPPCPHPLRQPLAFVLWTAKTLLGIAALILLMAVIAAVPIVSLFVLGYLLEVEGRLARTGKLRYAFPLLHLGTRIGTIVLGIGLWLLPVVILANFTAVAQLVDMTAPPAQNLYTAKVIVSVLVAIHLCLALARGGSFGCFFRPLKNVRWLIGELRNADRKRRVRCPHCGESLPADTEFCTLCDRRLGYRPQPKPDEPPPPKEDTYWHRADRKVRRFLRDFRIRHHFLLGWRGFAGAFLILVLPTLLFAFAQTTDPGPIFVTVFGGLLLAIDFLYVPFLQAHLAAENRFSAIRELGTIRQLFRYAPISWFIALLLVYALALPLYLFTAFVAPDGFQWAITLVFLVSIWPARVLTGWAYARAVRRQDAGRNPAWFGIRWGARILMFAATVSYTFIFFFARDISSRGRLVLFEHHAFLGSVLSSIFSLLP